MDAPPPRNLLGNISELTIESNKVQERIISETMCELATYQQREGIFTKHSVMTNAKTMAPAKWWATYGKHLPHMSHLLGRRLMFSPRSRTASGGDAIRAATEPAARAERLDVRNLHPDRMNFSQFATLHGMR